jgi:hypothetical protein
LKDTNKKNKLLPKRYACSALYHLSVTRIKKEAPIEIKRIEADRGHCTEFYLGGKWTANVPREGQEKNEKCWNACTYTLHLPPPLLLV